MKKIFALCLSVCLLLGMLAACQSDAGTVTTVPETTAAPETTVPETTAAPETTVPETTAAPETTVPETTAAETTAAPAGNAALSTDPFSFQISVDGNIVQLPCTAADLMHLGYSFGDKAENMLETGYTTSALMRLENGNYVSASIYNDSGEEKTFANCSIDDLYFNERNCKEQEILFVNGITFGAHPDVIKAIYGEEADSVYDQDGYLYLTYETEEDFANKIQFMFKDNALYEVDVCTRG